VSGPDADLIRELEARVAARRAAGDYEVGWLAEDVTPEDPPTPVDRFLRLPRARVRTELATAGTRGGAPGALRERITGWLRPVLEDWDARQAETDVQLRESLAWLLLSLRGEIAQREETEKAIARQREALSEELRELALSRLAAADLRLGAVADRVADLEERLSELERARRSERIAEVARPEPAGPAAPPPAVEWDYAAFEDRFRGPEEVIRARQRAHVRRFAGRRRVVDLGCGRGEILELLRENGVGAEGVDADAEMVAHARAKGLRATRADLFDYLAAAPAGSIDGVLASHVIEHLAFPDQVRLLRLAARALEAGGAILLETPNPTSLLAGSVNFRRDPTHVAPVHPDTLAFLLGREGFDAVEVEYLAPVPAEHRLAALPPVEGPMSEVVAGIDAALRRLDELVYGHQDYAVSGVRAE
jgi:SAM-dependent methyltransferase